MQITEKIQLFKLSVRLPIIDSYRKIQYKIIKTILYTFFIILNPEYFYKNYFQAENCKMLSGISFFIAIVNQTQPSNSKSKSSSLIWFDSLHHDPFMKENEAPNNMTFTVCET